MDRAAAASAIEAFLRALGRTEPELAGTGARVAQMFAEDLCAGYEVDTRELIAKSTIAGSMGQAPPSTLVVVRDLHIVTTCPHHLLPSIGTATVAFQASGRLLGLGTVAAVVDAHARRLALQEQLGEAIVADLDQGLAPTWVGCRIVLTHGCMVARGERAVGTTVETVALRAPDERRAEAYQALRVGGT